jgi:opacity protein-like surface antigen
MKRSSHWFARVLAFAVLIQAPAAAQIGTSVTVSAGLSMPTSTFGDVQDAGYAVRVGLGLSLPLLPVAARAEGSFDEFNGSASTDAKTRVVGGTVNAIVGFPGPFSPYVIGGVGYYTTRRPRVVSGSTNSSDFGANIGLGVRMSLVAFSVFAEARYTRVGDGVATFVPVVVGVAF